jgi:hypothetical protein
VDTHVVQRVPGPEVLDVHWCRRCRQGSGQGHEHTDPECRGGTDRGSRQACLFHIFPFASASPPNEETLAASGERLTGTMHASPSRRGEIMTWQSRLIHPFLGITP